MNFTELPDLLAEHIEVATASSDCAPDIIAYTAGEPAAPAGQCTAVWVWIDELYDMGGSAPLGRRGDEEPCMIRPAVNLKVRVDVCYAETDHGPTAEQHAEAADCLHGLMEDIWCWFTETWSLSGLLEQSDCRAVTIGPFQVAARQGGIVSAYLDVNTEWGCPTGGLEGSAFDDGYDDGFQ
jgi:hypothetical protein